MHIYSKYQLLVSLTTNNLNCYLLGKKQTFAINPNY